MTSIGTGYDLSNSTFSPDGRVFQVEYAYKAVENAGTAIGLRVKDGIVLATQKLVAFKLLRKGSNKRIQTVDRHIGIVSAGLVPDGRHLTNRLREETKSHRDLYKEAMPVKNAVDRLAQYVQAYTLYSGVRPFGVTAIIAGVDETGSSLYMVEPSGTYWGYFGAATGKGRQEAKNEIEKLDLKSISMREAVRQAARIIRSTYDDSKDKEYELEMSWELIDDAEKYAKEALEGEEMED